MSVVKIVGQKMTSAQPTGTGTVWLYYFALHAVFSQMF